MVANAVTDTDYPMASILIVDDEPDIREVIRFALEAAGFETHEAADAPAALEMIRRNPPDLLLLDWMLPGRSGLDLAKQLKEDPKTEGLPIIMVTARTEERDLVKGLGGGADDYITKPFSPRELIARLKALLRRAGQQAEDKLNVLGLQLDPSSHRVSLQGEQLNVTPIEFRLLHFFMTHLERVFSRQQLLDQVWGNGAYVEERTVDVHIRRLRKILEASDHDKLIQTVRGAGYRFSGRP
jgi:two-component system phosphate regulon response regulator PhoB